MSNDTDAVSQTSDTSDQDSASQTSDLPDDDLITWSGDTRLRLIALALFGAAFTPFLPKWLQALALFSDVLYLIPLMAHVDGAVNWFWIRQPARSFAAGRVIWVLLISRGLSFRQVVISAFCHGGTHAIITAQNYFLYHRTLFKYLEGSQYRLAMEFSIPLNPIQLTACELLHALVLRRFFAIHLSLIRVVSLAVTSFWFERVTTQILISIRREDSNVGNQRVFFRHWGASADSGHWLMQIEGLLIHIFKRNGNTTAEAVRPDPKKDREEDQVVPSLRESLYVPFWRYGIVGLTDGKGSSDVQGKWRQFIDDWITVTNYSAVTRSCQEFVVFAMWYLCHPPLFNMSDLKSLVPALICTMLIYWDVVLRASVQLIRWTIQDIFV